MALTIGDLDVHAKLCVGDIRSNVTLFNFETDTEHRRRRRGMAKTSVKRFFSRRMRGSKFRIIYMSQLNNSLQQMFLKNSMLH